MIATDSKVAVDFNIMQSATKRLMKISFENFVLTNVAFICNIVATAATFHVFIRKLCYNFD